MSCAVSKFSLSFGTKLTLWYAALLTFSAALVFFLAYHLISRSLFSRDLRMQQSFLQEIQGWNLQGGIRTVQLRLQNDSRNSQGPYFVRLSDGVRQSLFIVSSETLQGVEAPMIEKIPMIPGVIRYDFRLEKRTEPWIILTARDASGMLFQLGRHSTITHEVLQQFRSSFLQIALPVLFIATLGGALFTSRTLRPLHRLSLTTKNLIEHGDLSARVPAETTRGDLGELVQQFNRMLETNERLIRTMHDALDNVAHDLRTPITRLRGSAESALRDLSQPDPTMAREALADCLEEAEKIQTILNTLMDVAEARTGVMQLCREPLFLLEMVQDVTELYSMVAEEQGMTFHLDIPEELQITGDKSRLRQVWANLVDNAIKYGQAGQTIRIKAWKEGAFCLMECIDTGQGISDQDLPRIWERLYRGDKSRNKRGLGLGLSLVQAIVQAHQGTITVHSRLGEGTTFRIKFHL
jgi:signal transduction histidine kinase